MLNRAAVIGKQPSIFHWCGMQTNVPISKQFVSCSEDSSGLTFGGICWSAFQMHVICCEFTKKREPRRVRLRFEGCTVYPICCFDRCNIFTVHYKLIHEFLFSLVSMSNSMDFQIGLPLPGRPASVDKAITFFIFSSRPLSPKFTLFLTTR